MKSNTKIKIVGSIVLLSGLCAMLMALQKKQVASGFKEKAPPSASDPISLAKAPKGVPRGSGPKKSPPENVTAATGASQNTGQPLPVPLPWQGNTNSPLDRYAHAKVLEQRETRKTDAYGEVVVRMKLVRDDTFKHPILRVREELRPSNGKLILAAQSATVGDHIIVKMQPGVTEQAMLSSLGVKNATIRKRHSRSNSVLVSFTDPNLETVPENIQKAAALTSKVQFAEPDPIVHALAIPNDTSFASQWGMNQSSDIDVDAPEAWDIHTGNSSVLVGIIDTGVKWNHPDLLPNMWTNSEEIPSNGIDDDGNGFTDDVRGWDFYSDDNDSMDNDGHGTHCAGVIGASGNNGVGVAGVNWQTSMVGIRFLGPNGGTGWDAAQAIYYATDLGVDLTSNSWGYGGPPYTTGNGDDGAGGYNSSVQNAISDANVNDVLFVAAAGNGYYFFTVFNTVNLDVNPVYPAAYTLPNVITVGASTSGDQLASFTNYGATRVHLFAPGVGINSTYTSPAYKSIDGTSMACPHVAGACALMKSYHPELTGAQIKSILLSSVDRKSVYTTKCSSGGRLNIRKALHKADGTIYGPELSVQGYNIPGPADGDYFGEVRLNPLAGFPEPASSSYLFTLANNGEETLSISSVAELGHTTDFTLTGVGFTFPTTIVPGAYKEVNVVFNPSVLGARAVTETFVSNNQEYPRFDLNLQGTGVEPDIALRAFGDNMPLIADGDTTATTAEGTDYGAVEVGDYSANWGFFTIWNEGTSVLTVQDVALVAVSGGGALTEWELQLAPAMVDIYPGGQESFYVGFVPQTFGNKLVDVRVRCNDNTPTTESTYTFRLKGKGYFPVLEARGKGLVIASNAAASATNGTIIGNALADGDSVQRSFQIKNIVNMAGYNGNSGMILNFENIEILPSAAGNTTYLDFFAGWPGGLFPDEATELIVGCTPSSTGLKSAIIKITSNAALSSTATTKVPFYLKVQATGIVPGGLDTDFVANATAASGAGTAVVTAMVNDGSGRTLVAGNFTTIAGTARNRLARFNYDGTIDVDFNPNVTISTGAGTINCIAVQPDGKIIIGGLFTTVGGSSRGRLARLNDDGTLDSTFTTGVTGGAVNALTYLPDVGKWLVSGSFVQAGTYPATGTAAPTDLQTRQRLLLLNSDGTLDATFNLGVNPSVTIVAATSAVNTALCDQAGRVWIGGDFNTVGNTAEANLAVIDVSGAGSIDATITPPGFTGGSVDSLTEQSDGKIILGGAFTAAAPGGTRNRIARLDTTGALDASFAPSMNAAVNHVACQAGGGLLVGGDFSSITAKTIAVGTGTISSTAVPTTRYRIARLDPYGNLYLDFNPNSGLAASTNNLAIHGITIEESGDILIGGRFTHIGASARTNSAKLSSSAASYSIASLAPSETGVKLTLGAASAVLQMVWFERSTDGGYTWSAADGASGAATYDGAQWKLIMSSAPSGLIRAHCWVPGGQSNGSSSLIRIYRQF